MKMLLFALVAGCATTHAVSQRVENDVDLPLDVIEAAPAGVPVTATATVRDGRVSFTVTVTVGNPAPVVYAGLDPALARAAESAAYRQQWLAGNGGGVPGAKSPVVYVSPCVVTTASGGAVQCPERIEDIDTLDERVACLEADLDHVIQTVGVK